MLCRSLRIGITFLALALLPLAAQQKKANDEPRPDLPIEQWLGGPDRQDFKWKVELSAPRLTFQQRNLLQVTAVADVVSKKDDTHHDLYFVLKVADEKGNWLPRDSYNHYPLPPGVNKDNEIQYSTGFYAKPGKYTAALILYDATTSKGNLWRKHFEVKPPKDDALPGMDRNIPEVEFINEVPGDALPTPEHRVITFRSRRVVGPVAVRSEVVDPEWPLGHGVEVLPVAAPRPMRVDIVLNLSPFVDPSFLARTTPTQSRSAVGRILQIGSVLSHLDLAGGCVRVSAIDLSKLSVPFEPVDGRSADWDKLEEQAHRIDHNTVSVDVLGNRKSTPGFLAEHLSKLAADNSACGGSDKPERVVVLVSHDFQFPSGSHADRAPDFQCTCRFIYLRVASRGLDDIDKFLKPANAHRIDVHSPEQFRKALADLIAALSGGRERAREVAQ